MYTLTLFKLCRFKFYNLDSVALIFENELDYLKLNKNKNEKKLVDYLRIQSTCCLKRSKATSAFIVCCVGRHYNYKAN